ncbi:MAG: hypothetical protein IJ757_04170 [Clostridiales bacterium]|nr:hypothetical protein [Clostridiales bacterium]
MMPDYSELEFYVKSTDCATDSHLAPYVLLSDLQETADKGAADTGWGREAIGEYDCCWIVLRCQMSLRRLPSWKESFKIRTWSCGARKLFFDREYEIFDETGELIGSSTSVWILAEKETHRPVFPSKLPTLPQDFAQSDRLALGESCPKLKLPIRPEDKAPVIIKYADYTELDHNHHVNNTRYLAWIYDALYKGGYDVHGITDININYMSEVKSEERVELYIIDTENGVLVSGYREDDTGVFTSEIRFGV